MFVYLLFGGMDLLLYICKLVKGFTIQSITVYWTQNAETLNIDALNAETLSTKQSTLHKK